MFHLLLLTLVTWQEPVLKPLPGSQNADIWQELVSLETLVKETVAKGDSYFTISAQAPVRGFYVERRGVILMVPVRYRPRIVTSQPNEKPVVVSQLSDKEVKKRLKSWQDELRKQRINREANFEKVVSNLRQVIPQIVTTLANLPDDEPLTIIIEERVPTWYYPDFSLNKNPSTKVVALSIDTKSDVAEVHANQTEMRADWNQKVKRQNTDRRLAF